MKDPDDRERQELAQATPAELVQLWQRVLEHPDASEPVDALLEHPRARQLVQALPPQDLFLLIKHRGLTDSTELLTFASPEQFRTFVDLDGWKRDLPDIQAIAPWLQAVVAGGEELTEKFEALDIELQALILHGLIRIHPIEPEGEVPVGPGFFYVTPDRSYVLELVDPALQELAERLVRAKEEALGPLGLSVFLSSVLFELPSALEHEAARWRQARLEDLGFPTYDESMTLYAPLPGEELQRLAGPATRQPETELPRWLARRESGPELAAAMAELDPRLRSRVEHDLVSLVNALMVASAVDPGDDEAVKTVLSRARGYLSIALDLLGGTDRQRVAQLLQRFPLRYLFRFTATGLSGLRIRARRLARLARRLGVEDQAWLAALSQLPPKLPDGTEFTRRDQLVSAEAELIRLEDIEQALRRDPGLTSLPADSSAVAAFGTALAHRWLGHPPEQGGPLPEGDAREFLRRALANGHLLPEVRRFAEAWLADLLGDERRARSLAAFWCAELDEELGGLDPAVPLDPRFVGLVLAGDGSERPDGDGEAGGR